MDDSNTEIMGKKVFFLHPSAFVKNSVIDDLIQQEFEVYLVSDEIKIQRALRKYPGSVVFICSDEALSLREWETWVRQTLEDKTIKDVNMGIISHTDTDEVRKVLGAYHIPCGLILIKTNKEKAIKNLMDALKAVEAKGRRKYLRVPGEAKTTVSLPSGDTYIKGEILDISVVGFSCVFSCDMRLEKNALFHDIQVKLQTMLLKVEGIVIGSREEEGKTIYVFLFTPKSASAVKEKIRVYVQKRLQSLMEEEIR